MTREPVGRLLVVRLGSLGDLGHTLPAIPFVKDRAKTILELADQTAFVMKRRPLVLDEKTVGLLAGEAGPRLQRLRERLHLFESWDVFALEAEIKAFAEAEGVGFGKIGPPLRGVLAGGALAPDISRTLAALGRDESLARLDDALSTTN